MRRTDASAPAIEPSDVPHLTPGAYRHYKGGLYDALGAAHDSTNGPGEGRWLVLYRSRETGVIHARELSEFTGTLEVDRGVRVPRFRFVGASPAATPADPDGCPDCWIGDPAGPHVDCDTAERD